MRARPVLLSCAALVFILPDAAAPSGQANTSIAATVCIAPRTSLDRPTRVVRFHLAEGQSEATAEVPFVAGVRTRPGAEVLLLVVEGLASVTGPAGAADTDATVTLAGEENGGVSAVLSGEARVVGGRWAASNRNFPSRTCSDRAPLMARLGGW